VNFLHKLLPVFFLPVGVTLVLWLAGLLFRRRILLWIGLAVLWLCSTPLVSVVAIRAAEGWAVRGRAVDAPEADAIVVLSAGRVLAPGPAAISEWGDADRFFGGVDLFRSGKAPFLVFTGGSRAPKLDVPLEGEVLAGYARELGVPAAGIVTTGPVANTAEEARAVAALLRGRRATSSAPRFVARVLLVTSAFHMPRARWLFERAGLQVEPFPVDFQVSSGGGVNMLAFLPTAAALRQTETALREAYGRLFYLAFQ
jgi:uncharacterized SAM-binding protein YcdF (DUF218 family)